MREDLDVHLVAIRSGDARAFGAWLAAAEPSLRRGLRSFARQVDVEAVLQEALLRTWQVAPRFEADGKPNGLVRLAQRIAWNLAVSETRRRGKTTALDPAVAAETLAAEPAATAAPDPLLRAQIEKCRDKLPPKPREAITARLVDPGAVPDATLAERLGMAKNTFLQNVTRARKLLIECLRRAGIDLAAELA